MVRKHVADEDGIVRIPTVTEKDSSSSMEEDPENVGATVGNLIMVK